MLGGRIWTKLYKEEPDCCSSCGLGKMGCCVCLIGIPCGSQFPMMGIFYFMCLNTHLRNKMVKDYNIKEDTTGTDSPFMHCLCYPCSIFQMYATLASFDEQPLLDSK